MTGEAAVVPGPVREAGTAESGRVSRAAPTAGRTVAESLAAFVDRVFCVAGESYLPLLDALGDGPVDVVTCRHEGSAAFGAVADAMLTGRPGVVLVSRGPGAANAAIGVQTAAEDAVPLLLLVGAVPAAGRDRDAFQDVDCGRLFGGVAKAVWTLHDPSAAEELVGRAVALAGAGTPGPVVLVLPEDVLARPDLVAVPAAPVSAGGTRPAGEAWDRTVALLAAARRPLLLAGEGLDRAAGRRLLARVAARHRVPVVTSNKRQHLLPNRDPHYAGHLHNATSEEHLAALTEADLVLALGTRLDVVTTRGFRFPAAPLPQQPLVHVHADAARVGARHRIAAGFVADPVDVLAELDRLAPAEPAGQREGWVARLHEAECRRARWEPVEAPDGVVFGAVVAALDRITGGDVTVVVDAGTFSSWTFRHLRFGPRGRLLAAGSSPMGFATGAGVAAALRSSKIPTVVVIGDGGFVMNGGELATACQRHLPMVFVVADNGSYATIRAHQERLYPGRPVGTDLVNPDFVLLARAHGALGLGVEHADQAGPALTAALRHPGPAVVHVRTSLVRGHPGR